jgi:porphobilinogen deaminase
MCAVVMCLHAHCSDASTLSLLSPLNDAETSCACEAERAALRTLQGGCKVPIAVRSNLSVDAPIGLLLQCLRDAFQPSHSLFLYPLCVCAMVSCSSAVRLAHRPHTVHLSDS